VDALYVGIDALTQANAKIIVDFAAEQKLPTVYISREFINIGGLLSYGPSFPDLYYRAAGLIEKIFKGAKPGDLPVEQPTKLELIVNLQTAKALGLDISANLMVRADEVIEGPEPQPSEMLPGPMSDPNAEKAYPSWLESTGRLRDGTEVHLRPVRSEDEPLLQDLAAHMTPEDLRLRFFAAVRGLSHAVAARLAHIDYDRAMALLAEKDGVALGVARFHADPDRRRAEYAIAVRSDWKGHGLGYLLMTRLIAVAREWRIGELVGQVLRENRPMLAMCRELGFEIASDPKDAGVMLVRKVLTAG